MNDSRDIFNKERDGGHEFWDGQKDGTAEKYTSYFKIYLAVQHQRGDYEAQNHVSYRDTPVNPGGGRAFKNGPEGLVGVKIYGEN